MKKFTCLATALIVLAGAASCKKNTDVQESESQGKMIPFTLTAGQGSQKTSIGDDKGTLVWDSGDKLTVCEGNGSHSILLSLTKGENTASGEFSGKISDEVKDGTLLFGLYNATFISGTHSWLQYSTTIPTEQTYNKTSFQPGIYPSAGSGTYNKGGSTSITLSNPMGILRIKLIGTAEVTQVKITAASADIAGCFEVRETSAGYKIESSADNSRSITMTCTSPVQLTNDGVYFNFVTAPFAEQVVTVDVNDGAGSENIQVAVSSSSATQEAVSPCFKKAGTYGEATITGGAKVKWVQLWSGGPKWAVFNVGATKVEEYGEYYTWGGSENMSSTDYAPKEVNTDIQYNNTYDTARKKWGDNWQMPTETNLNNLRDRGFTNGGDWITDYKGIQGLNGYLVKGIYDTDYACNEVFFPAAGSCDGGTVTGDTENFNCWSSTQQGAFFARRLFQSADDMKLDAQLRKYGYSIRPILHE